MRPAHPDLSGTPFVDLALFELVGQGRRCVAFAARRGAGRDLILKVYRQTAVAKHARRHGHSVARYEYERNAALHAIDGLAPFIASPVDFLSAPGVELFLQERVFGEPLPSYLRTCSPTSRAVLLATMRRIVESAHRVGLFDLDLQPENIIVRPGADGVPHPMLFDFNKVPYHVWPPNAALGLLLRIGLLSPKSRDHRYWKRLSHLCNSR